MCQKTMYNSLVSHRFHSRHENIIEPGMRGNRVLSVLQPALPGLVPVADVEEVALVGGEDLF
jgi:hypothetical protein